MNIDPKIIKKSIDIDPQIIKTFIDIDPQITNNKINSNALHHFRPSGQEKNDRGDDLEPNALIGIKFYEFRQKLKNYEFRRNASFWQSLGTIWIDSVLFEVVPPILFFSFFSWECEFQDLALKFQILAGNLKIWV